MTIADEIQRIKTNIENAYTVCNNKGAVIPGVQNSDNLAACIDSIVGEGSGLLESIISDIVEGNNPVDVTDLQDVETQLADIIEGDSVEEESI